MKSYKPTCKLFEIMEVTEKIYEVGNTSKNIPRADVNRASHVSNERGENMTRLPTPIWDALSSVRQEMQSIQAIS